jgi:four helix bundle protein
MNLDKIEKNPLLKQALAFSLAIVSYCESLEKDRKYVVSRQLMRSGTSIGANSFEAQNAESKADFIHKLKIAAKEGDETHYWLLICKHSESYADCDHLIEALQELMKLLNSIIATSKKKLSK